MTIINRDCLTELKKMDSESIDCVITSPPYYYQRDYGMEDQIGLEETVEEYVHKIADVFDEIHRVLKKTGSVYLNIGDRYSSASGRAKQISEGLSHEEIYERYGGKKVRDTNVHKTVFYWKEGVRAKNKCLMKIPDRVVIELINRGWILRNEIIWNKTNGMPFPTTNRFVQNYEKVFFLTKSEKYYHKIQYEESATGGNRRRRAVWDIPNSLNKKKSMHTATFPEKLVDICLDASCPQGGVVLDPFAGTGTTGKTAQKKGIDFILIELNKEYLNPSDFKNTLDEWMNQEGE